VHQRRGLASLRVGPLKPGLYRVTVLDPGPPPRTASLRVRQQRPRAVTRRPSRKVTT